MKVFFTSTNFIEIQAKFPVKKTISVTIFSHKTMHYYLFTVGLVKLLFFLNVDNVLDCNCIEEFVVGFTLLVHAGGLIKKATYVLL